MRIPATFFLALLAFVVYRANNLPDALTIYRSIFSVGLLKGAASVFHGLVSHSGSASTDFALVNLKICLALFAALIAGDIVARRKISFANLPRPLQISIVNAGVAIVLSRWIMGHGNETFAYYKF